MPLYVAFLRGIGPARKAPGDELRRCFGAAGYERVTPVLATGNVVFSSAAGARAPSASDIETMLGRHFGYPIPAILRSAREIAAMFALDPFRRVDPARQTRFVCMLGAGARPAGAVSWPSPDAGFRLVGRLKNNLFLVRDNDRTGTPEMMVFLDRAFGSGITTRNWNTMEKIRTVIAQMRDK